MKTFNAFSEFYGPPDICTPASSEVINQFSNTLPPLLLEHWQTEGWGSYDNGLIWVINPLDLQDVLADWQFLTGEGAIPFLRTSLGQVFVWQNDTIFLLDILFGRYFEFGKKINIFFNKRLCKKDFRDNLLYPTFHKKAVKQLGALALGECYGFFPALALGGKFDVAALKNVKLHEYLGILAQMSQ